VDAGVSQHSRYREDPLGRLTRTASFVTTTGFGAMPEVDAAIAGDGPAREFAVSLGTDEATDTHPVPGAVETPRVRQRTEVRTNARSQKPRTTAQHLSLGNGTR